MKIMTAAFALICIPSVWADDFQDKVDGALALQNQQAVIERLEEEAYRGNLKAAYRLGLFHRAGEGVSKDAAAAYERFEQAGEPDWIRDRYKLGLPEAQYEAGIMLRDGVGVEADAEEAATWFERAAEQGHARAQLALAELYLAGRGVDQDHERAYVWASLAGRNDSGLRGAAAAVRAAARSKLQSTALRAADREVYAWTADQR